MLSKKDFDIAYCVQRIQICAVRVFMLYGCWLCVWKRTEHCVFNAVGETPFALTNDTDCFERKFWILFCELNWTHWIYFLTLIRCYLWTLVRNSIRHIRSDKHIQIWNARMRKSLTSKQICRNGSTIFNSSLATLFVQVIFKISANNILCSIMF